jgi:hypothetical protein
VSGIDHKRREVGPTFQILRAGIWFLVWFYVYVTCLLNLPFLLIRPICQMKNSKLYLEW